ncbi:MAG: hypothetical protein JRI23_09150 [Deltaproteobacteria bacterium]|jgi:hypothetical protein|nr:hypothetical protein [Deltaproteobacteria bacterium]MBW2531805.1 hypothetical protein [Deltaproteobacteria bacterium]
MNRILVAAAAASVSLLAACETDTAQTQDAFQSECSVDSAGKCRYSDGRFAPASCCPGQMEIVVPTQLDLAELIEQIDDGIVDMTYWEDEGVSCGAENIRDHQISGVLTDEFDHFTGLEIIATADLPYDYCAGYGATSRGTCWVRMEVHEGKLGVWDVQCEETAPYD